MARNSVMVATTADIDEFPQTEVQANSTGIPLLCMDGLIDLFMVLLDYIGDWTSHIMSSKVITIFNKQIMPEVIILGCIYVLPAYRDLMRAEGPKHIPIY